MGAVLPAEAILRELAGLRLHHVVPQFREFVQNSVGFDDFRRRSHGRLQVCPRRASISSAAAGPHEAAS